MKNIGAQEHVCLRRDVNNRVCERKEKRNVIKTDHMLMQKQ